MRVKPKTLGAVHTHTHTHTQYFYKKNWWTVCNNALKTKKEKIKKQRENYSNVQFDIRSENNFLFLCCHKLICLNKYLRKKDTIKRLFKTIEEVNV